MYCEYFKLHKIITDYISANVTDKKITEFVKSTNYPVYKDLEPFKEYKFETVLEIHENILNLLSVLISTMNNKENELLLHRSKQNIGLNIDNFISTFNYNIIVMREKINMFITYIEFFHKLHKKYLKSLSNKIELMHSEINNDIHFNDNINEPQPAETIEPPAETIEPPAELEEETIEPSLAEPETTKENNKKTNKKKKKKKK
jgi:hypothetical protein